MSLFARFSKPLNLPLRRKLFLSHFLAIFLVSASIGGYLYISAVEQFMTALQSRLLGSAALISRAFDVSELDKIVGSEDRKSEVYIRGIEKIRDLARSNPDIAYIYVMRKVGNGVVFVLDSDDTPALPGEVYEEDIPELMSGFEQPSVDEQITSDKWGSFLSGYAPVKDGQGRYLVGIDIRAGEIDRKLHDLKVAGLFSLALIAAMAFVFSHLLSHGMAARINHLAERCGEVAEKQLEEAVEAKGSDEITRLDQTFGLMAQHLDAIRLDERRVRDELRKSKEELEARVEHRTAELRAANDKLVDEIRIRKRIEKILEETARTDFLTGLLNRRAMMQILGNEAARVARRDMPFSLALMDIDRFKNINDEFGHQGGDEILEQMAAQMETWVRKQDVLARWGGEEYLILLSETCLFEAREQAERLRRNIEQNDFRIDGRPIRITASFGISEYVKGGNLDACIKEADEALYRAKRGGRNRVVTYVDPKGDKVSVS